MNTKLLFVSSAIFLFILGSLLTFIPQEILRGLPYNNALEFVLVLQLLGALYLGFAIQNWFVRGSLVGGIYNKPILLGNVLHFTVGAFALLKTNVVFDFYGINLTLVLLAFYAIFTISFFMVTFKRPKIEKNSAKTS